jgi:hypothetical protein
MVPAKVGPQVDSDGPIGRTGRSAAVDWTGLVLGNRPGLPDLSAGPLGDHPLGGLKHVHLAALPTQHLPAELDDAATLTAAEVLEDVARQTFGAFQK